jgi:hypothetical protein
MATLGNFGLLRDAVGRGRRPDQSVFVGSLTRVHCYGWDRSAGVSLGAPPQCIVDIDRALFEEVQEPHIMGMTKQSY